MESGLPLPATRAWPACVAASLTWRSRDVLRSSLLSSLIALAPVCRTPGSTSSFMMVIGSSSALLLGAPTASARDETPPRGPARDRSDHTVFSRRPFATSRAAPQPPAVRGSPASRARYNSPLLPLARGFGFAFFNISRNVQGEIRSPRVFYSRSLSWTRAASRARSSIANTPKQRSSRFGARKQNSTRTMATSTRLSSKGEPPLPPSSDPRAPSLAARLEAPRSPSSL